MIAADAHVDVDAGECDAGRGCGDGTARRTDGYIAHTHESLEDNISRPRKSERGGSGFPCVVDDDRAQRGGTRREIAGITHT